MLPIPVIDVAPYLNGRDKQTVAHQIGQACTGIGFFTIRGHGIPLELIRQTNNAACTFFDAPWIEKRQFEQPGGMGYIGPDGENLAASLDNRQVQDVKESLNLTLLMDEAIWPTFPLELRLAGQQYYTAVLQLAHHLMRLFALALDLPET